MASPRASTKDADVKMNHCRLCGEEKMESDLSYIFGQDNLVKNAERYFQILIFPEDPLSHNVCTSCVMETDRIVKYITNCQRAQQKLHCKRIDANQESVIYNVPPNHDIKNETHLVCVDETSDMSISKACLRYTSSVRDVPGTVKGERNTSIMIVADNPDEEMALLRLDRSILKELGRKIYDEYHEEIMNSYHLTKTISEIREHPAISTVFNIKNELENLRDPLQEEIAEPAATEPMILHCVDCSFTASKYWYLNQHYKDAHAKPFSCDQCGRAFGHASKLRAHVEVEHSHQFTFMCNFCNEKFRQKCSYTKHMKTHLNDDQLWPCDECSMQFGQLCKLNLHKSKFHKSEELPCLHCTTFIAKSKHHLKQHVREVHRKSFECNECGKKLSKKSRLLKHIQNKHGEKITYVCQYCQSKYTSKRWYEMHIKNCPCAVC